MIPVNLYLLTRAQGMEPEVVSKYDASLLKLPKERGVKPAEFDSLASFVSVLRENGVAIADMDGFYYGYSIPQISKEFDLLKLSDETIVNIELKSRAVSKEKICRQLQQNRHYLSHLPGNHFFFTYISTTGQLYTLTEENELVSCQAGTLCSLLTGFSRCFQGDINEKFRVPQFLISPINSPEKFLSGRYFLTDHQNRIEKSITDGIAGKPKDQPLMYAVKGKPGTGKSLLLCHIAKVLSARYRVCIIMCAPFTENYYRLQTLWKTVDIMMPTSLKDTPLHPYDLFIMDETQRIYDSDLEIIWNEVKRQNKICIFGFDPDQILSQKELDREISEKIESSPDISQIFNLKARIRTNRELADCIELMIGLQRNVLTKRFPHFQLSYASTCGEANELIAYYVQKGYQYISYTPSPYDNGLIDQLPDSTANTHTVIGQEYDNVLLVLTEDFYYDGRGKLRSGLYPNPDYIFSRLFYQGVSRVREQLAVIVLNNPPVFEHILELTQPE